MFNNSGSKLSLDALLPGENGNSHWKPALSNEWGRLTQSKNAGVAATDTIKCVPYHNVPTTKKMTYDSFVYNHIPLKDEEWRICLVIGGDKLEYSSDSGSPATDLTETKMLLNSIISDANKGARFASMDSKRYVFAYHHGET